MSAQSLDALAVANEVRLAGARLRATIRRTDTRANGLRLVADMLEQYDEAEPDLPLGAMRVDRLLDAIPRIGAAAVSRLLGQLEVRFVGKRVRDLTDRQRSMLAQLLRDGAEGRRR